MSVIIFIVLCCKKYHENVQSLLLKIDGIELCWKYCKYLSFYRFILFSTSILFYYVYANFDNVLLLCNSHISSCDEMVDNHDTSLAMNS